MDKKKGKISTATGGEEHNGKVIPPTEGEEYDELSEEEVTWLKALREFKLSPGPGGPEELNKFLRTFDKRQEEKEVEKKPSLSHFEKFEKGIPPLGYTSFKPTIDIPSAPPLLAPSAAVPSSSLHNYPKLSVFSGDGNKGEESWEAFKFEVESLIEEHTFVDEQLLLGIRRALKGTASDIVRRLGTGVTVRDVITKLNSTYGSIENSESVMRKFYSCAQGSDSVSTYAVRLEDLYAQAVELKALARNENILKQMLNQGLKMELKHIAQYKFDTIPDYDQFKMELRKLEAELIQPETKSKTCHAAQKVEEKNDLTRLEDTVKQLQQKIEQLELNKNPSTDNQSTYAFGNRSFHRGFGRGRSYGTRGYRGRGRGVYEPSRPLATNTFRGACYRCGGRGHFSRDCTAGYNTPSFSCYRCGEKGHLARDCQVDYKDIQQRKTILKE